MAIKVDGKDLDLSGVINITFGEGSRIEAVTIPEAIEIMKGLSDVMLEHFKLLQLTNEEFKKYADNLKQAGSIESVNTAEIPVPVEKKKRGRKKKEEKAGVTVTLKVPGSYGATTSPSGFKTSYVK